MTWEHKGITFHLAQESLGSFVMVSARVPSEGPFVRIRPFSALGRSEEEALAMVNRFIPDEPLFFCHNDTYHGKMTVSKMMGVIEQCAEVEEREPVLV